MKKKIYQWHRTTSLIIAIPVILWASSGFMHPIMTTIRPKVATQFLQASAIDTSKIKMPLQEVLSNNHIDSITNFRFVHIDTNWFYQIQLPNNNVPTYVSTKTGKRLANGDWLYAQYLAKHFLEGQENNKTENNKTEALTATASSHDCCDAASECVLNNTKGAKVTDATSVTAFDNEYKSINRLLPVYKVVFARADGIRIYVETTQDRFSFAMDNKRAIFDAIFRWFHNWGWLSFLGKAQFVVEFILVSLAFLTALMGVYIFFISKSKKVASNTVVKTRRSHRFTSIAITLFTLMFTFSGAYHAFTKIFPPKENPEPQVPAFASKQLHLSIAQLQQIVHAPIANVSIVIINGQAYWQVNTKKNYQAKADAKKPVNDLMKAKVVPPPSATYINTANNAILQNGELVYASYLASQYSGHKIGEVAKIDTIVKFADEYGFVNKRLPVFKVAYNANHNERYYIETSTGKLALRVDDIDVIEGYSFSILHKHEFMAWAGKPVKDFSTMFWAMAQIAVVVIGMILYFKTKAKKKMSQT
ncbi:hypothetical protein ACFOW1_15290 [Parasediminibacterium paludis]|uniref:PepSY-associated transmembrane protein n=1 Tax=Parasediminibacterium paludis TaxID=908966 RepID=A0ABV8Q162_9BACT